MDIAQALQKLRPGANFDVAGGTYADINWTRETILSKPTEQEVNDTITANQYKTDRQRKYPPLADLADAIYWNEKGDATKLTTYIAACDAVKTAYPKP